ncbi:MAG: N-acetyltransferase [Methanomassiliicoccaceae archaeon]|nr:N-acetyltransferase [Methanomassiliicoccaceae archaeon]
MECSVEHDEKGCRFNLMADGQAGGYIIYEVCDGCFDIQHTVVYPELRGNGLGEVLVAAATEYAESKGFRMMPTCSYAKRLLSLRGP